ncbi:hypothetical protein LCGC14_1151360 [marine sediment metagenome]|uniref:ABC transporter domain-containing protein n=1 Tax=marine sediment metagenome TaxID=412755 RepID=A0A0F9LVC1_9ZZZZ|nr:ABC transporter ATP-binding protein [Desulfobacterales bacterium]
MALLDIRSINKSFGGLKALSGVSLSLIKGEILALIGPNGSGKTTLLNAICRIHEVDSGEILFNGEAITNLYPWNISKKGIGRTFQLQGIMEDATVFENVFIGAEAWEDKGFLNLLLRLPSGQAEERRAREKAKESILFVGLEHRSHEKAINLPLGEMRLVEIARALLSEPEILIMDESFSGLSMPEAELLQQKLLEVNSRGISILFVEHNMRIVRNLAQRVYVLNFGELLAQGTPDDVMADESVIEAYLGRWR